MRRRVLLFVLLFVLPPILPTGWIGVAVAQPLVDLAQNLRAGLAAPNDEAVWRDLVAWEELSRKIVGKDYIDHLAPDQRQRLYSNVALRLRTDLTAYLAQEEILGLDLSSDPAEAEKGKASFRLRRSGGPLALELSLVTWQQGFRVQDLAIGKWRLSRAYRDRYKKEADSDYSYGVLEAALLETPYVILEDFSGNPTGQIPQGWVTWRKKDEKKPKLYQVRRTEDHYYVAAKDTGHSVILGKPIHWNPHQYPILTWCWRAETLPTAGNEKVDKLNDSAAGLYVLFSRNWMGVPQQIKYVWSTTLPEQTWYRRPRIFRPYFLVVESGETNLGRWTFEQVDLVRDHKRAFDGDAPPKRTLALGMLTDANSTDSYAEAFYADFRAWTREAQESGLIEDYCGCYAQTGAESLPKEDTP
jgi:hypothetical protein